MQGPQRNHPSFHICFIVSRLHSGGPGNWTKALYERAEIVKLLIVPTRLVVILCGAVCCVLLIVVIVWGGALCEQPPRGRVCQRPEQGAANGSHLCVLFVCPLCAVRCALMMSVVTPWCCASFVALVCAVRCALMLYVVHMVPTLKDCSSGSPPL
jgi:hypothetical protein